MKGAPLPLIIRSNAALILHDMQNDFIKQSLVKGHRRYAHVVETEGSWNYVEGSDQKFTQLFQSAERFHRK